MVYRTKTPFDSIRLTMMLKSIRISPLSIQVKVPPKKEKTTASGLYAANCMGERRGMPEVTQVNQARWPRLNTKRTKPEVTQATCKS